MLIASLAASGRFSLTLEPDQKLVNWSARDSMVEKIASHQDGAKKTGAKEWESENFTLAGPGNATKSSTTSATTEPASSAGPAFAPRRA